MRNIFLEKLYPKCGGEAWPRTFYKKPGLCLSLYQQPEMLYSVLLLYVHQNILKLRC